MEKSDDACKASARDTRRLTRAALVGDGEHDHLIAPPKLKFLQKVLERVVSKRHLLLEAGILACLLEPERRMYTWYSGYEGNPFVLGAREVYRNADVIIVSIGTIEVFSFWLRRRLVTVDRKQ